METHRDDRVVAAVRHIRNDQVIAEVRASRDAYAALHGHDIGAIFKDIRAAQEAAGRAYVRHVEPLARAMTPVATQVTAAVLHMERSLGPVLERLNEWAAAAAPFPEELDRIAGAAGEAAERIQPFLRQFLEWNRTADALDRVGWLPHHSAPHRLIEECGDDLALLDNRVADYYRTGWTRIRDDMESRLADYHIDDEARAAFREALSAHEAGQYRCVCRVLFPEIERMIGAGRVGSKKMLEKLIWKGPLSSYGNVVFRGRGRGGRPRVSSTVNPPDIRRLACGQSGKNSDSSGAGSI